MNDGPKLTVYRGSGGRDVFYNRGDLRDCFRAFASRGGVFDGILFPDGVTAAVFLRCLKESGGSAAGLKMGVPGEFGGRTDAEVFRAVYDCGEVGRRAVMCVRLLEQNEYARFSAVVPVRIPGLRPSVPAPASVPAVDFFADGAVREALRFERLMHACGDADRAILKRLCDGWSYSRIGRTLYMSNQNVRYRVRRLLTLSGYADTADMLADYAAYGP